MFGVTYSKWPYIINKQLATLITWFLGRTRGPSGADKSQVSPMLAPWTLLSGLQVACWCIEHFATYMHFKRVETHVCRYMLYTDIAVMACCNEPSSICILKNTISGQWWNWRRWWQRWPRRNDDDCNRKYHDHLIVINWRNVMWLNAVFW